MVANQPWQKSGRRLTPAEDRLAMVEAAVAGRQGLEASRMEIDRGGDTYTADTLEQLHRKDPDRDLFLIVGTDVAAELHTWKRPDDRRPPGHPRRRRPRRRARTRREPAPSAPNGGSNGSTCPPSTSPAPTSASATGRAVPSTSSSPTR